MNYWFISKIDNFICKCSSQLDICLTYCFFSFLGDNNIWWQFLPFVITLIEEGFATQIFFFCFQTFVKLGHSITYSLKIRLSIPWNNCFKQHDHNTVLSLLTRFDSEWVSSYIALTSCSYPFFFVILSQLECLSA